MFCLDDPGIPEEELAKPKGEGYGTPVPLPFSPNPVNPKGEGSDGPDPPMGFFSRSGIAVSSRKPAMSIDFRRFESSTWYRCFPPNFSAPDLASTRTSLSSNTSIGICAFHVGI